MTRVLAIDLGGTNMRTALYAGDAAALNMLMHERAPANRTAFVDRGLPGQERLMMRLWLVGYPPRPLPKNFLSFDNKSGLQGIDKQEGRVVGQAKFTITENMIKTAG